MNAPLAALGSTCSNLCQAMGPVSYGFVSVLSPKASWRPQKTTVIFIDSSGCCREQRGKKKKNKKTVFFFGGGAGWDKTAKHDQMIENASNSMQPLSFVRPVVGMWKLGSLWRKGHRGKYLTFESCTLPTFRPPWFCISDIFSIRLWFSSPFLGTYYREVRRPSTTYTLHSPPMFWT